MKTTKMLMVTSLYPYGNGETFITAELEHVARHVSHIEIVPGFYPRDAAPRPVRQPVNLAYADGRWGALRVPMMVAALLSGLFKYRWLADFKMILKRPGKVANFKELVRGLYRASMFERFLEQEVSKGKAGYDVIYFYWLVPEILGAKRFCTTSGERTRVVCRAHRGDLYEELKPAGYAGLRREIVAAVDEVYCISEHGKRYLDRHYAQMAAKFQLARLGVNDPGYLNRQPGGGPLSIVSCSFVIASKRLPLLVDAIAHLLAADPTLEVRWTHVGNGPLLEEVRAHAARSLGPRAQALFKGYMTQAELMDLYRADAFDLIVNVSDSEGIPVSLMEAASAGIPIVATDVGGSPEIIGGANGVLVPADADAATIAAAIARFKDRDAAAAWRRAARRHWDERFNAAVNYDRFGRILAALPSPSTGSGEPQAGTAALAAQGGDRVAG
ncbi:glycosyltransferase [Massilia sp. BSC265]|uniref:glycosyltransferase n=1 Tax=Massilia sp. BSC265 TaxID=1549812 RepID=UPI00068FF815|nr:glycosyltransferase [Massilia sp. BSC265]